MSTFTNSPAPSVLFRCDGSPEIGLGHIVRCLALADELRERGCKISFLVRQGPVCIQMAEKAGYTVLEPAANDANDQEWIARLIREQHPDILIMDFRNALAPAAVLEWREQGVLTVTIDDPEDKRVACDLVFSPPVPQVRRMSWAGFTGKLHAGWEWVLLRGQFANVSRSAKINPRVVVLVAMGGSDPAGLTLKAVRALDLLEDDFKTIVIVGGAFCHNDALETFLRKARRQFEVRRNISDMAATMAEADMAVASFSVTAYELAAVGVPGIYLCLSEDHAEAALAFVEAKIGVSLGVHHQVTETQISERLKEFLREPARRAEMSRESRRLVDGRGAKNIAGEILQSQAGRKVQQAVIR